MPHLFAIVIRKFYDEYLNPEDFHEGDQLMLFLIEDTTGSIKDIGPEHYVVLTPKGKLQYNDGALLNAYGEELNEKLLTSYI